MKKLSFSSDLHESKSKFKKSSKNLKMPSKCGLLGFISIFIIVSITLYFAFAFPYSLFHLKQTETTEIKSVIIVGRNGEVTPKLESYFIGETAPDEISDSIGFDQLTNIGKERMYLLGKFLKLRYYHLLLNGNPRKIKVRSSDIENCLESAQALLAGLNPPKENWLWSTTLGELNQWQPKAIHTTEQEFDDLLADDDYVQASSTSASTSSNCFAIEEEKLRWKNSTKYQQLLNEFRHDLQLLRSNTGLEFEDDLEIVNQIENSLKCRKAYKIENVPSWYTTTFANRLAHIGDVTTENQFSSSNMQRLHVGRLLHEIAETINGQIKLHQQELLEQQQQETNPTNPNHINIDQPTENNKNIIEDPDLLVYRDMKGKDGASELDGQLNLNLNKNKLPLSEKQSNGQLNGVERRTKPEPNVFIYMTNKNKLSALLNSLQVYSSQPIFGSLLLIEIHYDPINNLHFLRLYSVSSTNPNVLPEPVRLNPIACVDSAECEPQQFEQNIRHLMLDKNLWKEACMNRNAPSTTPAPKLPLLPLINDNIDQPANFQTTTTTSTTLPPAQSESQSPSSTTTTTTTTTTPSIIATTLANTLDGQPTTSPQQPITTTAGTPDKIDDNNLEENLLIGPTNLLNTPENESIPNQATTLADVVKIDGEQTSSNGDGNSKDSSSNTIENEPSSTSSSGSIVVPETLPFTLDGDQSNKATTSVISGGAGLVEHSDKSRKREDLVNEVKIEPINQAPAAEFFFENNKID